MNNDVSIIIPVYNEEKNIEKLTNEIIRIDAYKQIKEIIFVDDCSKDNSRQVINSLMQSNNKIKLLFHEKNFGQSSCILTGCQNSFSDIIITMDADGQNNPKDISEMLKLYRENTHTKLVGGIRTKRKDSLIKKISSLLANYLRKKILKDDCDDTGCSLKVFDREMFLKIPFFNGIHRFMPALFKYSGSENFFINVDHREREFGISKYGTFDRALKGFKDIVRVKKIIKNFK
jgi:dolichol-phosphate mannosyltransferase